jgi:hypothetical protein
MNKYEKAIDKISQNTSSRENVEVEVLYELVERFTNLPNKEKIQQSMRIITIIELTNNPQYLKCINDISNLINIIYGSDNK